MTHWIQLNHLAESTMFAILCSTMRPNESGLHSLLLRYLYHTFVSLLNEVTKPGLDTVFSFTPFMDQPCCLNCFVYFFFSFFLFRFKY